VTLNIDYERIPFLSEAISLAEAGYARALQDATGGYGDEIALPRNMPAWRQTLLTDPQTSEACSSHARGSRRSYLRIDRSRRLSLARIIGSVSAGESVIRVT